MARGQVTLVGAGPGDPELITVKGLARLRTADVVLYDRLVGDALLKEVPVGATLIDVGKIPGVERNSQSEINRQLVTQALLGKAVVRLKGGDPLVFGRGSEEIDACREAGIAVEVIPGISSALAAPAMAGIPVTLRGIARSFTVITAHAKTGELPDYDFDALARMETLVVLMGLRTLDALAKKLIDAGLSAETPVATIANATMPQQEIVTGSLSKIAGNVRAAGLAAPVVTVIGAVAIRAANAIQIASLCKSELSGLKGRRVVVTQAASTSSNLQRLLSAQGAQVVHCPLIEIGMVGPNDEIRSAVDGLRAGRFDWVVFTSVHGVRAFWQQVQSLRWDARVFGRARLAALGHGTAAELAQAGLQADLIPAEALATSLVASIKKELFENDTCEGEASVLFPRGNLALPTVKQGLAACGFEVVDPIVYETHPVEMLTRQRRMFELGFDALVFCSPSAVDGFVRQQIVMNGAVVGCIGPTTAAAARAHGLQVDVVPDRPGSGGLVAALAQHFSSMHEVQV